VIVAIQAVGLLAVAVGLFLLAPWLGVTVAGLELATVGVALELKHARKPVRTPRDS
jgi:hypothetical protein